MISLTTGFLLGRARALVMAHPSAAIAAIIGLAFIGVLSDLVASSNDSGPSLNFISAIAQVYAVTTLTNSVMNRHQMIADGEYRANRFFVVFGVSFLANLGILFGMIFLIIPGVFLLIKWSISIPCAVGDSDGVIASLRDSWHRTTGHFWPIFGAMMIVMIPIIILFSSFIWLGINAATDAEIDALTLGWPFLVLSNLAVYFSIVFGWYVAIAAYESLTAERETLGEVFA